MVVAKEEGRNCQLTNNAHPMKTGTGTVQIMFFDFSSAAHTIQPVLLDDQMKQCRRLFDCLWSGVSASVFKSRQMKEMEGKE